MNLFQTSVVNKYLSRQDEKKVDEAFNSFKSNYSESKILKIKKLKEEEYQDGFLRDLFVDVLGYTLKPDEDYNLAREYKNQSDGKKADGAILKNDNAIAVIELKSTRTKDLTTVTNQAFNYKNNQPGCHYVITSNFQKLRLYIDYANEWEEFDLFNINRKDFSLLYLLLHKDNLLSNLPLTLKEETLLKDKDISIKLYRDYSNFKNKIYQNLVRNNHQIDKLTLYKKSQKFLDRLLFIFFSEDTGLIPPNTISIIIDNWSKLKELDAYSPLYDIYKKFFGYFDKGSDNKNYKIPKYNGGLFAIDDILDNLIIDDEILKDDALLLSSYNFNTDVDVNILGHIFEHSLNEIEEITAEIEGRIKDNKGSKRKKDGVFYTPQYITQFIVENTVGKLCFDKRQELNILDFEIDDIYILKSGEISAKGRKYLEKLNEYKDWLLSLKILDPACGSGAFLNQVLNFLILEHKQIDGMINVLNANMLRQDLIGLLDIDKEILENNLYGVDINEESVEIAKLSLWLRTAQKGRELSNLNNNIKCGNSLIDDLEIAGDKAFNWKEEFKEIFDNGGFDVIIGNPPYVNIVNITDKKYRKELQNKFATFKNKCDLYSLFIEQCTKIVKINGEMGFIFPNSWMGTDSFSLFRKYISKNITIEKMVQLPSGVFSDAIVKTIVMTMKNVIAPSNHEIQLLIQKNERFIPKPYTLSMNKILSSKFYTYSFDPQIELKNTYCKLGEKVSFSLGIKTSDDKRFIYNDKINDEYYPMLRGRNIGRYYLDFNNEYIWYKPELIKEKAGGRPRVLEHFTRPKILIQDIAKSINATYDEDCYLVNDTLNIIYDTCEDFPMHYILGLLNSSTINYWFNYSFPEGLHIKINQLQEIPLIDASREEIDRIEYLVKDILKLKVSLIELISKFKNYFLSQHKTDKISKKLQNWFTLQFSDFIKELNKIIKINGTSKLSKLDEMEWMEVFEVKKTEVIDIQSEITKIEEEIDVLVMDLYGLTLEERALIKSISN